MTERNSDAAKTSSMRISSIDTLRGLTILGMIFVNDLWVIDDTPWWLKHFPGEKDGMTFSDVIFPAFLFIVGMVIPAALTKRLQRGETTGKILAHILKRWLSLLIIGVFMVNMHDAWRGVNLSMGLWSFLTYLSVMMVWHRIAQATTTRRRLSLAIRCVGIVALVVLAFVYKVEISGKFYTLKTRWWGILGLIGWAYLVACVVYGIVRRNAAAAVGVLALMMCVYIAGETGFFQGFSVTRTINSWVNIGGVLGSRSSISVAGLVLGIVLLPGSGVTSHRQRLRWAILYGVGLAVAAILLRPAWEISKSRGTPSWCLWGSAITCWVWAFFYWLNDVRGYKVGTGMISPAGENPLTAYLLAPLIYTFFDAFHIGFYKAIGASFWPFGLLRAIVFSLFIVWLTGRLRKMGFRLGL